MPLKAFIEAYNLFGQIFFQAVVLALIIELRMNVIRLTKSSKVEYRNILPVGFLPGWAVNGDLDAKKN